MEFLTKPQNNSPNLGLHSSWLTQYLRIAKYILVSQEISA